LKTLLYVLIVLGGVYYYFKKNGSTPKPIVVAAKVQESADFNILFEKIKGKVTISENGPALEVHEGTVFKKTFALNTTDDSMALISFGQNSTSKIKIGPNSTVDFSGASPEVGLNLKLNSGELLFNINTAEKENTLKITTKNSILSVRGTQFYVKADYESTLLLAKEGAVEIQNSATQKSTFVTAGTGFKLTPQQSNFVETSNYKVNWNIGDFEVMLVETFELKKMPVSSNFFMVLETSYQKCKQGVSDSLAHHQALKAELVALEDEKVRELAKIEIDVQCLNRKMQNCEFSSKLLSNDMSNIKNQASRFVYTDSLKDLLTKEIAQYKEEQTNKIEAKKVEIKDAEVLYNELEKKFEIISAKKNQLKTDIESGQKNKAKYKELVDLIDNIELRSEFQNL
jgi:hypothetical protein